MLSHLAACRCGAVCRAGSGHGPPARSSCRASPGESAVRLKNTACTCHVLASRIATMLADTEGKSQQQTLDPARICSPEGSKRAASHKPFCTSLSAATRLSTCLNDGPWKEIKSTCRGTNHSVNTQVKESLCCRCSLLSVHPCGKPEATGSHHEQAPIIVFISLQQPQSSTQSKFDKSHFPSRVA